MDLKRTFILRAVQQYVEDCEATFELLIRRKKIGVTDELLKSFRNKARGNGEGATGELIFKEYGRMVDMGVGRGQPLGALAKTRVALQSKSQSGLVFVKDKTRRPKKFYSPVIYGKLTYLQNKLLYGYGQEAIDSLKAELENKKPNT